MFFVCLIISKILGEFVMKGDVGMLYAEVIVNSLFYPGLFVGLLP